jgi:hypothetical protein
MRPHPTLLVLFAAAGLLAPARAAAQPDDVAAHAIVIGSNAGGPGQETLRFAEKDALRVAEVLRDLGGYPAGNVRTVLAPTPARLLAAIDEVGARVAADRAAGRRTLVFFYYSGHARARALVLGRAEVPLADLRARLDGLPATVTIVVLDACQSGAFSRVKGAEPTADFSYNSRASLDAEGIAVLASSSESELSQESDFLQGSYFTHHLLVGLRGGADRDGDGRVSLAEAYQYAYHQTLVATSHTAVGSQHVRLEVSLEGHGEVALTYPEKADATLSLPAALAGDVLVQRLPAEAVLAEVHKVAGARLAIAVPAGRYRVLVRTARAVRRCPVTVAPGGAAAVELDACDEVPLLTGTRKHGGPIANRWALELSLGLAEPPADAFTRRLETFGYQPDFLALRSGLAIEAVRRVAPYGGARLAATGRLTRLVGETWRRRTEGAPLEYAVTSHALTLGGRAELPSAHDRAIVWAAVGAGATRARDRFADEEDRVTFQTAWGLHLTAGVGVGLYPRWLGGAGVGLDLRWLHAPTVDNAIGDTLDVGGLFAGVSVLYRP